MHRHRRFIQRLLSLLQEHLGLEGSIEESALHDEFFGGELLCIYTGPKSLVFSNNTKNVIKAYLVGTDREPSDIAKSYESAWRENSDLFPEAHKAGEAKITVESQKSKVYRSKKMRIVFVWQRYVDLPKPDYDFKESQWDRVLEKWDRLIERHKAAVPSELKTLRQKIEAGDEKAHHAIAQRYYDGFSALQAGFAIRKLKRQGRSELAFLKDFQPPVFSIFEASKIVGDISPKHVFCEGPYLAFDLEKYGLGDPAKDLSMILRSYLYRDDPAMAERVLKYLKARYSDAELLRRVYLCALGSGARILKKHPERAKAIERLKKVVEFYPKAAQYL